LGEAFASAPPERLEDHLTERVWRGADGKSGTGLDYRDCDKRGTANFAQRCRKKMMRKGLRLRLRCCKPGSASLRDYLSIGHKCK